MNPIRIIDVNFNLLAEIDDYESLIWTRRWQKPGEFELHIDAGKRNVGVLQKGNIIILSKKAGIIRHRGINMSDTGGESIVIKGPDLSGLLSQRITIPPEGYAYDRINAPVETIMKRYVDRNAVNPFDVKRKIPHLVIANNLSRGITTVYQTRFKSLEDELSKLSTVSGLGWGVNLDVNIKKWVFDVYEGRNLTARQIVNPPVIFSVDFDAVMSQEFIDSAIGHYNQAYVGGQGEGIERAIVEEGSNKEGLERIEMFVDARDIENAADLPDRGKQKLAETPEILSFENKIATHGPYRYGEDWDLGDIVTTQNRKWGVTLDARITEVREIYEDTGFVLEAVFGSTMPTLSEKIKQEIDSPLTEKSDPVSAPPGSPGISLQYDWQGPLLGIKREDELEYNYANLQGPKGEKGDRGPEGPQGLQGIQGLKGDKGDQGIQGPKGDTGTQGERGLQGIQGIQGPKGDTGPQGVKGEQGVPGMDGKTLEFTWNGTQLGVRQQGQSSYTYVELKGAKGDQGIQGIQGLKGDKGDQGLQGLKGDTGADGKNIEFTWNGTQLGVRQQGQTSYTYTDLKGAKGDTGAQGLKGDKGDKGDTGLQGLKGDKGDQGLQGLQGLKGDKGDQGIQGKNLEFSWNGTKLGVRQEGQAGYTYIDLQGPQGIQGVKGDKGDPGAGGTKITTSPTAPPSPNPKEYWFRKL